MSEVTATSGRVTKAISPISAGSPSLACSNCRYLVICDPVLVEGLRAPSSDFPRLGNATKVQGPGSSTDDGNGHSLSEDPV